MSITNSQSLLKFMSIESVMPSSHLILCHPLHLLPSIFPSIRVFSNESVLLITWPNYWSFSFSISPSNNIQDWFPLGCILRWWSRRTCVHLLLRELQNYNSLLNNHWQENVGSHQKKIPHIQRQRRSPSEMVGGAKLHLESNPIGNQLYFNLNKFFFNFKNEQNTILGKKRYGC